jgi:hypothetical protein
MCKFREFFKGKMTYIFLPAFTEHSILHVSVNILSHYRLSGKNFRPLYFSFFSSFCGLKTHYYLNSTITACCIENPLFSPSKSSGKMKNHKGNVENHKGFLKNHKDCVADHKGCEANHKGFQSRHKGCGANHKGFYWLHKGCETEHKGFHAYHKGNVTDHKGFHSHHKGCELNHKGYGANQLMFSDTNLSSIYHTIIFLLTNVDVHFYGKS